MIIDAPREAQREARHALWREAFDDEEEFLDLFERTAYSPDRCRTLCLDGSLAAALYWFDCECEGEKLAYLYAIATAKEYRGRGLCRALMANTHEHLKRLGYAAAILVPSQPTLFAFYERQGYATATGIGEISCAAASREESAVLRQLDIEEYARLRREFLPPRGVVQERENLSFLRAQAELWQGENFLLAARKEKDRVIGIELLGEIERAPSIVRALGASEGHFRTVGSAEHSRSFAMMLPLQKEIAAIPDYFGLAFDL